MDKEKYLNFPIALIKNAFIDHKDCMNNIFDYSIYRRAQREHSQINTEILNYVAFEKIGITLGNARKSIENFKLIANSISSNTPTTGIHKDIIFDYYKNSKDEFQIATFCTFCAVRSILGTKPYCKTNKAFIHARMFGYSTIKEVPGFLNPIQNKYLQRYHIDKVLLELQMNWGLKLFADHCRGFYLSFTVSHEVLAKVCLNGKKSTKNNKLKNLKRDALIKAKNDLNLTAPTTAT